MAHSGLVVTTELGLRLVLPEGSLLVGAVLGYAAEDPFAVHLSFDTGEPAGAVVTWSFDRALLTEGMRTPSGDGDVKVFPAEPGEESAVVIALSSPHGRAVFEAALGDVVEFLAATYEAVPSGTESDRIDLDAVVALLLG